MAEEKREKKKRGIIKRIFRWIWLGWLVALIFGALVLDAPWKVTALLLIMLAAHTILPKAAIKWFWLSVAGAVVILIIWVFLPDKDGGWRPYKYNFDEELTAIEAKYIIPDELNAATIYNKLLQDYDWEDFYSSLSPEDQEELPTREPWLSKDHPKIAEWLNLHQNTMQTLLKVSKIEKCRFPITDPANFEKQIKRNTTMRQWAFLLIAAVNNDIAEDRADEALQKNLTLLQMGNHLCQQPAIEDLLVGMAIRSWALPELKRFIITRDPEETHLRATEEALGNVKCDWGSDLIRILESDKLSTKREFARYYEINLKGKIRLSRDPLAEIRANCRKALRNEKIDDEQLKMVSAYPKDSYERIAYPSYFEKKLVKAYTALRWFYVPSNPQKAASIIDAAYEKYYAMAEPDFDWQKEAREFPMTSLFSMSVRFNYLRLIEHLAGMSEKMYYQSVQFHDIYLRLTSNTRGARIMIALRQYKNKHSHWPENLDEVKSLAPAEIFVDPVNGNSFVYKLADDSFKLYSKGENNIDEDGKRDKWGEEKTGADDRLIWPPRQSLKPKGQETYKPERNTDSVGKVIQKQNIVELPGQKEEGAKMIVDRIENAHLYAALNDRFTKAFEILTDSALPKKEDGRYEVDGDKLYYIVQHYTTKPREECKLEAHKKYIDVQFVVSGQEIIYHTPLNGLKIETPYDASKDVAFYKAPAGITAVNLAPGMFCILFPQDAHIPCCRVNGPSNVHKVVVKVKMDDK